MPLIVPNATDTSSGNRFEAVDQAEPDSLDFEILSRRDSGVVSGCAVTPNSGSPSTSVSVSSGQVVVAGVGYSVAGNSALAIPSAPADNRFDLVVVRVSSGVASLFVVQGTNSSTNPSFPSSASVLTGTPSLSTSVNLDTDVVLAAVYRTGASPITASRIVDKRTTLASGISDQGTSDPATTYGSGVGSLFLNRSSSSSTGSGVWVKTSTGSWIELAQNTGPQTPIGAAMLWPSASAIPSGFLEANGQSLSTATYPALFSVYGYTHGGSGGTFSLPNYNNRFVRGTTSTSLVGTTASSTDSVTLSVSNLPSHSHEVTAHTHLFNHQHTMPHTHTVGSGGSSGATENGGSHTHTVTGTTAQADDHVHPLFAFGFPAMVSLGNPGTDVPGGYFLHATTTWYSGYLQYALADSTLAGGSHTHTVTGNTNTASAHRHNITVNQFTGNTDSQTSNITSTASANTTESVGSGTPFSIVPASSYSRWIIRASIGSDSSSIGGVVNQPTGTKSASFAVSTNDLGVLYTVTGTMTVTVPADFPVGGKVEFFKTDTTTTTFASDGTSVIRAVGGTLTNSTQYKRATLQKLPTENEWVLSFW